MARPRVFLSSTYYNLKQLRTDLETFVSNFGYELSSTSADAYHTGQMTS